MKKEKGFSRLGSVSANFGNMTVFLFKCKRIEEGLHRNDTTPIGLEIPLHYRREE